MCFSINLTECSLSLPKQAFEKRTKIKRVQREIELHSADPKQEETKTEEDNVVQSTLQLQRCYKYRPGVSENLVKKLSPKTPISQNLQSQHSEDILLLFAKYE